MAIQYINNKNMFKVRYSFRIPNEFGGGTKSFVRSGIKTKRIAEKILDEMKEKSKKFIEGRKIPTWKTNVERYIDFLMQEDRSKKSVENTWLSLKSHTFPKWENRLVSDIQGKEIRDLIKIELSNKAFATQKDLLKYIRGAFRFALEEGYIKTNPSPAMKFRIGDKIKKGLNEDQIRTLLSKARLYNSKWYPIYALAVYTGMRNGELFALTWDKVDLNAGQIIIDSSWNNKDGFKSTKSGDDRIADISPQLMTILKELHLKTGGQGFVLPRLKQWEKGEQARELRRLLESAGLPSIRFHDLRASWATIMLSKGIEPLKVMSMGGWKELRTMQIYIRKAGVNVKGIADDLDFSKSCEGEVIALKESRSNY